MKARLTVNRNFVIGEASENIFGGFIEHLGRCVYNGIYEPGHPEADENGFRRDVAELVRELDMPLTRYPGGNFVSGYNWKDGVGPVEDRPIRADYAWKSLEPNIVGIDEFMKWCRIANTEPMYAVNICTNTPKAAQEIVEYCNFSGNSYWSNMRKKNGSVEPYNIRYWCLGNEVDGEWQIGHMTAEEYGRAAHEAAKMMRMVDPDIKLFASGSSTVGMPTFGTWDYTVLNHLFNDVDYLSIHIYFGNWEKNTKKFLASAETVDYDIETAIACCDTVAAIKKSPKRLNIALDEWNVWYRGNTYVADDAEWVYGQPLNEETYDMEDVLVDGSVLLSLLDHADRLKVACLAQTVNVIAPIMTRTGGGVWRQTIFYPFRETSRYGRGTVLRGTVESAGYKIEETPFDKEIKYLRSTAVWRKEAGEITVFAINRSEEEMDFEAVLGDFNVDSVVSAIEIHHESLSAVNTENDEQVVPCDIDSCRYSLDGNTVKALLKPYSWNMLRIKVD